MSCNYADGLSPYHDKGQLGLEERFDTSAVIAVKVDMLAKWINKAKHVVVHTGAGISTSAGIPDFRGPNGVWTLEAKGKKPEANTDFNEALPTVTHMALTRMVESGKVKYVVSQNIDGLHLRSGLPRKFLSELHGNMFVEQCNICHRQFVRNTAVPTVGQKCLSTPCPTVKPNGRPCRGRMHDTILDWEHNLPENDLAMADFHSCLADLSIAVGTTMQIIPSGSLPLYTKKTGGKLVIINLQPTKHDSKADLLIRGYADEVMTLLLKQLSLRIPKYVEKKDPSIKTGECLEWTITNEATAEMRRIYENQCGSKEAKKRLEVIDEDDVPIAERLHEKSSRKRKEEPRPGRPNDSDSDLEVVAEIKKKRGRPRKHPLPGSSIPVTPSPPPSSTKLILKKNNTPNKTKYEIVTPRDSKRPKVEIVPYSKDAPCDLEMICESDGDDVPITTNFRLYLDNDGVSKRETADEHSDIKSDVKTEENDGYRLDDSEIKVAKKEEENTEGETEHVKKDGPEVPVECLSTKKDNLFDSENAESDVLPNREDSPSKDEPQTTNTSIVSDGEQPKDNKTNEAMDEKTPEDSEREVTATNVAVINNENEANSETGPTLPPSEIIVQDKLELEAIPSESNKDEVSVKSETQNAKGENFEVMENELPPVAENECMTPDFCNDMETQQIEQDAPVSSDAFEIDPKTVENNNAATNDSENTVETSSSDLNAL